MKVCVGCVYEYDWTEPLRVIPEGCKGCKMVDGKPSNYKQKPQTNADRIRAMSDEELAKECVRQFPMYLWPTEVRTIYFDFENHNKNNAINAWLEWLKQPADRGEEDG